MAPERPLWLAAVTVALAVATGCDGVAVPQANVCFEKHVVPLVRRDCALCHERGEYGTRLQGTAADYDEIARWVTPNDPAASDFLAWAAGKGAHPVVWAKDSAPHRTVAAWVAEGARRECFDRDRYGECRTSADCAEVACFCPTGELVVAAACATDTRAGGAHGRCATEADCAEPAFGLCRADAAPDAADASGADVPSVIPDVVPDIAPDVPDVAPDVAPDVPDVAPDVPPESVSFSGEIVPLLRLDCRRCHSLGQYGITLVGTVADYDEVMRYVDRNAPEAPYGFLWWSAGGGSHPRSWPKGYAKYNLFLQWVNEGAANN